MYSRYPDSFSAQNIYIPTNYFLQFKTQEMEKMAVMLEMRILSMVPGTGKYRTGIYKIKTGGIDSRRVVMRYVRYVAVQ